MDQLEKLKKKRASIRASVTKLISKIDSLIESDDRETETHLEILDQLSRKEESLRTLNGEIEGFITSPTDYDTEIVNSEEYEDKIISCKFKIQSRIKRLEADSSVVTVTQGPVVRNNSANIKLPEIPLPKFSGKYEEWSNFKMQFDNIISSNEQLSAEQKLHYLKAALVGEAKSLETLNDSFASLFQALQERYENKKLIVETHVNAILDSVKLPYESARGLRSLIDSINRNMRALKVLGYERNELSDILILNIVLQKLDKETLKQYEFSISSNDVPKLDNLISFLEKRSQILENINKTTFVKPRCSQDRVKPKSLFVKCNNSMSHCILCKQNHPVYTCDSFLRLEASQRNDVVAKNNLCFNCLSDRHKLSSCNSKSCCKICRKRHNTLLHREKQAMIGSNVPVVDSKPTPIKQDLNPDAIEFREGIPHSLSCIDNGNKTVILSTAMVWVLNHTTGASIQARAVLDSGSMSNIVTRDFASRLGTPQERIDLTVSSISGNKTSVKFRLIATIINGNGSFSKKLEFLVVPRITDLLPVSSLHISKTEIPCQLADPRFATPGKIDMLIGAEAFFEIVKNDQIRPSCNNNLTFRNTVFGYIATGSTESNNQDQYCGLISEPESVDKCLQRFWQIESLTEDPSLMSKEEEYCEDHYQRTHRRNEDGRYIVQMATKDIQNLGESRKLALRRLNQLWKRLSRNNQLKELYQNFMKEYLDLDHMEKVQEHSGDQVANPICYYLPHHGVFRPDKTTTKLRVVFNASAPTTSGLSLNDHLLKGEVKEDVFEIMTRFRKYKYAFTADIQKMFRQILIEPSQRDLLRIVWKNEEDEMPVTYRLKTVTYGTASAPFLAVRTLKQLAHDEAASYPLASKTILRDVYMDDIVSGEQDFDAALELQSQLCNMLSTCGMTLHKWNSNSMKLMNSSSPENKEHCFSSSAEPTVKTLGIIWKPVEDQFIFKVSIPEKLLYTKREVLSVIARLYDPLGLLAPVIIRAKIFLQKLWLSKLNWEDALPENLNYEWVNFVSSLKALDDLKITRYILTDPLQRAVLLGYADASESAYGAVVYMHCIKEDGAGKTRLIASKSRVAPLKVITIPRLELSACLVLSQLIKKVRSCLRMDIAEVILHTDSTIAIAWINTPAYRLKTFIANRVEKIRSITEGCHWKHIASHSNPADVVSRGLKPQDLLSMELWWSGPQSQLASSVEHQDEYAIDTSSDEQYLSELKNQSDVNLMSVSSSDLDNTLFELNNNYMKLIRILSYIFRFLHNIRHVTRRSGPLSREELQESKIYLIGKVQGIAFAEEIKTLQMRRNLTKGQLSRLHPFLDKQGLMRVGGRLSNSNLPFDKKFPILLPKNHKLTYLIMRYYHLKNLHVGAQTLLYLVRQEFWPLSGRNLARRVVHECIVCFRNKPKGMEQILGNLPSERITPNPPFKHVGIDFCGPFLIKYKGQRKGIYHKCYVAIFVCLVTRAIHLEVVTDLTTEAMIATLKRFFSRRGKSASIWTDNATNFVGASAELKRLHNYVRAPPDSLADYLTSEEVTWKFIPPRSPNFGGLWEAGVKSFKHHLKRTVGNSHLTIEQFITITTQIEGVLNSRPLTPMSTDPNDFQVLTPGHFLIGRPLISLPESDLTGKPDNYLSQWQMLTKFVQVIWRKWKLDYLNNLQARHKWQFEKDNITPNSMVLLKDENLPPGSWSMGRVQEVIKGSDGKVRVVLVKTPKGVFKRSITKLCLLPSI